MTLSAEGNELAPRKAALSVCLDDSPVLGGLSRGIRDMAQAVGGVIVSLDSGRYPPSSDDARWHLTRVDVGSGPLVSRHLRLSRNVARALDQAIAGSGLVVCHSLYRAHLPFIRRSCLRHSVPYWVVAHGMLDPWVVARHAAWKRAWLSLYGIRCLADAALVIFNTEAERAKASPWCRHSSALVIPWPVDLPAVGDRADCRAQVRRRMGIPASDRILLSLTRYDSLKRPAHAITAFATARRPGWHLVMAGYDGHLSRGAIERLARRVGGSTVHVLGPVEGREKHEFLVAADAFISFSWRENFGYAMAEAAAYGLCSAVSPDHDLVSDMPECCRQWVADDHSLVAATKVLRTMMTSDPATLADTGRVARDWANQHLARKQFQASIADAARCSQAP